MAALFVVLVALVAAAALRGGSHLAGRQGDEATGGGSGTPGPPGGTAAAGEFELCGWQQWRLPGSVVPSHYELELQVPLNSSGALQDRPLVQGSVGINVTVLQVRLAPMLPSRHACRQALL